MGTGSGGPRKPTTREIPSTHPSQRGSRMRATCWSPSSRVARWRLCRPARAHCRTSLGKVKRWLSLSRMAAPSTARGSSTSRCPLAATNRWRSMWTRRSCRACMRALISRRPWMRELLWVPQWPTLWRLTGRTLPPPECSRILPSCSPSPRFPNTRETSLLSILTFDLMYYDTLQPTPIQWSGKFLGTIIGWDPSVCKSKRLHVDIDPSVFLYWFEVYSINSSKVIGNSPEVLNLNRLFLKLNRFICN